MNLLGVFPPKDFALIAVILGMPLLGAFVNGIWGRRLGKEAVKLMALAAVGLSFLACSVAFVELHQLVDTHKGEHVKLVWTAWEWMHTTGGAGEHPIPIDVRFSIDALSGVMMLIVTGVGFLIHLYSTAYMDTEKPGGYARFFAYLNLFVFSMMILILADNLPLLFVGWEGVGFCSYILIGFWYEHLPNAAAGKKAFIANRIGDFGVIVAMFLLAHYTSSLDWDGMSDGAQGLLNVDDPVRLWPVGGGHYGGWLRWLDHPYSIGGATAVGLALLLGCTGKSAQIPLYVWLPDAMAGPTPVSALIHAATMVTAGVYLVCRMSFVFVLSPVVMETVASIGALTAFFAATIALVQNDIKRVLAYSTVSQLGFMFLGVGVGAFSAGFFHVFTHAFFKACLFLGAGSVIHAMHARIHDGDKAQDMRHMGGLRKYMPLTFWTFVAATVAIAGLPLTSGFFSKDEILYRSFIDNVVSPVPADHAAVPLPPPWLGKSLYVVGVLAATMTAFYMMRALFMTFFGEFRGWTIGRPSLLAKHEAPAHDDDDHGHEHHEDLSTPGYPPHESPWPMTVPLIVLGAFSIFAGWLNPGFGIFKDPPIEHWLKPVFEGAAEDAVKPIANAGALELPLALGGIGAFAVGTYIAYWMYIQRKGAPAKAIAEAQPALYRLILEKWRIDELYDATVIGMVDSLAETSAWIDTHIVDGVLARFTALLVGALGTVLRAFQNGVVHVYAAMMVVGLAVTGWFFIVPHADASIVAGSGGDYTVTAGPGMGYAYRWDADADGKWDSDFAENKNEVKVHLDPEQTRVVRLAVKNAFGLVGIQSLKVTRPAEPKLIVGQLP